ncbi:MAG: histidine kinase internal region [Herbinix sp.]|nr:histidine kinase internal region [Herbinix sp.]
MEEGRNLFSYHWYGKLKNKIIISIYLVLFPVLILSTVLFYYQNYRTIMKEDTQLYKRFTQSVCDDIDYLQKDVVDIFTYFTVNADINQVLLETKEELQNNSLFWTKMTPLSFLQDILAIKNQIKTLILYPENGARPYYLSRDMSVHNMDLSIIQELPIYTEVNQAPGDIVWHRVNKDEEGLFYKNTSDKIIACKELYDLSKVKRLGFLAVGTEASSYTSICESMLQQPNEGIVIINNQGEEFARAGEVNDSVMEVVRNNEFVNSNTEATQLHLQSGKYYIFLSKSSQTGMVVRYLSPVVNWEEKERKGLYLPVLLALALLLCAWPLSTLVSKVLTRQTSNLSDSMEKFRNGDFNQTVKITSQDEIGQLALSFNQMVADIRSLINKNYVMVLKEKEIELDALQAQINPHFLYNVLDSFYWRIIGTGNDELGEDVLALSKLFRLLLNQGNNDIEVKKEIELIESYLKIQKMRFSRRLSFEIDVAEDILDIKISKLMIQPFVENAIVHGLEKSGEGGLVRVTGRREDNYLVFTIEDNGIGMNQEEADRILMAQEEKRYSDVRVGHYAIRNIKERLALRYGDKFILEIHSEVKQGTLVKISMPLD